MPLNLCCIWFESWFQLYCELSESFHTYSILLYFFRHLGTVRSGWKKREQPAKVKADVRSHARLVWTHRFLLKGDFGMSVTGIICSPGRTHMMGPSSLSSGSMCLRLDRVPHGRVRWRRSQTPEGEVSGDVMKCNAAAPKTLLSSLV